MDSQEEDRMDKIEKCLVKMETNQSWIMKQLSNHLAHHDKWLWWIVGAIGTIGIGLILNAVL